MKKLYIGAVTTGAGTLAYAVPTGFITEVKSVTFSNTTTSAITFALHFVASGGSVADSNQVIPEVSVPANTFVQWCPGHQLNSGDFIQAIGSASGMTIAITGEETRAGT